MSPLLPLTAAFLAPLFSCVQSLPQLHKLFTSGNVRGISILTLILFLITNVLWLVHGYYQEDWPIIISEGFAVIINALLIVLYLHHSRRRIGSL